MAGLYSQVTRGSARGRCSCGSQQLVIVHSQQVGWVYGNRVAGWFLWLYAKLVMGCRCLLDCVYQKYVKEGQFLIMCYQGMMEFPGIPLRIVLHNLLSRCQKLWPPAPEGQTGSPVPCLLCYPWHDKLDSGGKSAALLPKEKSDIGKKWIKCRRLFLCAEVRGEAHKRWHSLHGPSMEENSIPPSPSTHNTDANSMCFMWNKRQKFRHPPK